jgi:hypothetical protein
MSFSFPVPDAGARGTYDAIFSRRRRRYNRNVFT